MIANGWNVKSSYNYIQGRSFNQTNQTGGDGSSRSPMPPYNGSASQVKRMKRLLLPLVVIDVQRMLPHSSKSKAPRSIRIQIKRRRPEADLRRVRTARNDSDIDELYKFFLILVGQNSFFTSRIAYFGL